MRIIAKKRLREFWTSRKGDAAIAERDLIAWYDVARNAEWKDFGSLKQTFGSADLVGSCIIFDVGNNRFRLIGRVFFRSGKLYVLKIMDHREYDKRNWVADCRCHEPQPRVDEPETVDSPRTRTRTSEETMNAKAAAAHPSGSDPYLDLVKEFRLVPIRDDAHLDAALAMIDRLLGVELDDESQGYLDVLTDLVEAYEDEHVVFPPASEADVLRSLMQSNKISQSTLSKQVGIAQSTISDVLRGVRVLTRDQVVLLARRFNVGPEVFLSDASGRASVAHEEP